MSVENELFEACWVSNPRRFDEIIKQNPQINVNWKADDKKANYTCLHVACLFGNESIVIRLLKRKNINLNCKDSHGCTAFKIACLKGFGRIVEMIVNDYRFEYSGEQEPGADNQTPLSLAAWKGHLYIVMILLSKIKNISLGKTGGPSDAILASKQDMCIKIFNRTQQENKMKINILLNKFKNDPKATIEEIQFHLDNTMGPDEKIKIKNNKKQKEEEDEDDY